MSDRVPTESFDQLVADTLQAMYRLAARLTGSMQEAEDVVQDSYARAWEAFRSGHYDGRAQMKTWLYRIVTNTALDSIRARRRRRRWWSAEEPDSIRQEGQTETHAALAELAAWLKDLPEEQRAALILKEMEGLSSAEIGQVLGCSEGAVEQKLVRARAALRERSHHERP